MVAVAVMAAGYGSALSAKFYAAAGVVGLLGAALSVLVFLVNRRLRSIAMLADDPVAELEDRLASSLEMDSLRMVSLYRAHTQPKLVRAERLYAVATGTAVLSGLAAAFYAWFGH